MYKGKIVYSLVSWVKKADRLLMMAASYDLLNYSWEKIYFLSNKKNKWNEHNFYS